MSALAKCGACNGYGVTYQRTKWDDIYETPCAPCEGTGLVLAMDGVEVNARCREAARFVDPEQNGWTR